jgi:DNA polymerase-3 subunit alpha
MSSFLTSERNDLERISILIDECKKMGLKVLPPDINESFTFFSVVPKQNEIRFGLSAIKNVGSNIVELIVKERKANGPYASIENFISRINSRDLNKKSLESMIKAGVFDEMEERNKLLFNLERLLEYSRENQKEKNSNQGGLFEQMSFGSSKITLSEAEPAPEKDRLAWEKDLLGLFVSSHPLSRFEKTLENKVTSISKATEGKKSKKLQIKIGGIVSKIKKIITKTGKPMMFVNLEDLSSKIEVVVFPRIMERSAAVFQENKVIMVSGRLDSRDGVPKIICDTAEEVLES